MGASVIAYWPGMTKEQFESQPGFWNDDRAWANWMAEIDKDPAISDAIGKLKVQAILTYKTDPMEGDESRVGDPSGITRCLSPPA